MAFCEDCGAPLSEGMLFCENCGVKVTENKSAAVKAGKAVIEEGILYTNLPLLAESLQKTEGEVTVILEKFIETAQNRGIGYQLCDASKSIAGCGSVDQHIAIIKALVEKNHPKYLFIIGSSKIIPSIVWKNEASDFESDADVSSDLPYSTLDTASPFDGQEYDFDNCLKVGRLPESGIDLEKYFENLEAGCGKLEEAKTFALSAQVWQAESADIYKNISDRQVFTSPACENTTITNLIEENTNLFLFNLHGSNKTEFWYGQTGNEYPTAMDHNSLSYVTSPYFLMVEACYGAFYEGRSSVNSILLSALKGKCISFLGSSRIAFGTPCPQGCCADVIASEHLKNLKKGMSAGESLSLARKALMQDDSEESIKTLAEFSLYGDPSARMKGEPLASKGLFSKDNSKSFTKGVHIPLPNIRRAIKMELTTVNEKIAAAIEEMVYSKYEDFKGIKPKYYKSSKDNDYSAVFKKQGLIGDQLVTVKFEKDGKVKNILESK